ncbi:hypothetical protein B296_00051861 [Ensete ventricosum]|uniref:Uncharacterized protein n=1 Tax=Ensete ventricosum TaxID=4639 RepID=A0A426YEZ9_ENSVE|nr:hypothetical protein B296_00051861 [Ensete ventricosum]
MRSLDDVPRPLFLIALDEEKIAAKKSPPREVLLIRGVVLRYRLVADGLHIGLLANQYIPPIPRGTMRNGRL